MPLQYREGLLWVEVSIPQSPKPLNFLLDTGAGMSVINLNTAKRLGLKAGRPVTVHGVGSVLTGYREEGLSVTAGSLRLPGSYLAIDLQKLSDSCQQPVDGLIGMDFFRDRIVQIDFDSQKLRIFQRQKEKSVNALPLDMRTCGMRVPISINGHDNQWVRLDTGCASPVQWVTTTVDTKQCLHRIAIGLTEMSVPQTRTTVALGGHEFKDVPTDLHDSPIFPGEAGLLGNGLLSRFSSVTIDGKSGRLIFGPLSKTQ